MSLPKGKLPLQELERLVFPHIPRSDDPRSVMLDFATTKINGNLVVASDPVIGIPKRFYGFFAVHYSATDVAMAGAIPRYLTIGVYYPPDTEEIWLKNTMKQLGREADKLNICILGGHTGGYDGLQIPLIATTCFGELLSTPRLPMNVKAGDVIIAVGPVARETLWFVANVEPSLVDANVPRSYREEVAEDLTPFVVAPMIEFLPHERIKLMHDLAEGGLASGLMELKKATGLGITIQYNSIPWDEIALRLFEYLNWDALHCSSFGSFLIIVAKEAVDDCLESLKQSGRNSTQIGQFTRRKRIAIEYPNKVESLKPGKDPYQRFTSEIIGKPR
ncbi:MAG: AIR synthase-related protein [Candidatus Thorarchaeota archaeon]